MRILIISFRFPPFNSIGAVRVGKTAKYLTKMGHEVKVVTAARQRGRQSELPVEIPESNIFYTGRPPSRFVMIEKILGDRGRSGPSWCRYAFKKAEELLALWSPDIIYASALPYNSLLVASSLSHKYKIPWVAEFRDLWADNHSSNRQGVDQWWHEHLENRTLSNVSGMVTVSEPLAGKLRIKYDKPVSVILNGFDPGDYPLERKINKDPILKILYTGMIYNKQDPSPLFAAIKLLGSEAENIKIAFYGSKADLVNRLITQYKIESFVKVYSSVSYKESLTLQINADVLLLLNWNDPAQKGIYTGKLFEYIGARRPILAIGSVDNVASELIINRKLGIVSNDPSEIATQLRKWIKQKNQFKEIPSHPLESTQGFTREEQTIILDKFLKSIIESNSKLL